MNAKGFTKMLGIGLAAILPLVAVLLGAEHADVLFARSDAPLPTSAASGGLPVTLPPSGSSLIVATTNDELNANGVCSLREAIMNANQDNQSGSTDCAAGSGADTITFSLSGTITMTSDLPHITSQLTLAGLGQRVVLSGNDTVRVFYVEPTGSLALDNLSLQHGNAGSGQGGGIYNGGGSLVVSNCTLADNRASHGGAIFNYGNSKLTLANSTLSGNLAASYGGGIANYENSTLTITNSTLTGNSAGWGGGIDNASSTITMISSTLSGNRAANGGAIHNYSGPVVLAATILDRGDTGANCYGSITDSGYNLSDDGSCSLSGIGSRNNATLNLGPLADNSGPTLTHLPGAGSAAIDLIPNGTTLSSNGISITCSRSDEPLDTDQRGEPRPAGGLDTVIDSDACDAGAVESGDLPAILMLTSPANGSTIGNSTPTFDWADVAGSTYYQIQVDDQADFSSPVLGMIVMSSAYTSMASLPPGTYYWSVRAGSDNTWGAYSEPWKVTLIAPPDVPTLQFPPNGSITAAANLSFVWGAVNGATRYQIQLDDNADFSSPAIDSIVPRSAYETGMTLPEGAYYWRVRAGSSIWGTYSSGWGLICSRVPAMPVLMAPADRSTTLSSTPTFDWNDVPGAVQYQIQVDDSADFSSPLVSAAVTASAYASASPLPRGAYYWRVRAGSSVLWGGTSAVWVLVVDSTSNTCSIDLLRNTHTCGSLPTISFAALPAGGPIASSYRSASGVSQVEVT